MYLHDLDLVHYSPDPELVFDRNYTYPSRSIRRDKPRGFWITVDGEFGWREWCLEEGFQTDRVSNRYQVHLSPNAEILHLEDLADLVVFSRRYGTTLRKGSSYVDGIDWSAVAQIGYDGILISPYQWEARFDDSTYWYYSWDCASGVIWNLNAIDSVDRMEMAEHE